MVHWNLLVAPNLMRVHILWTVIGPTMVMKKTLSLETTRKVIAQWMPGRRVWRQNLKISIWRICFIIPAPSKWAVFKPKKVALRAPFPIHLAPLEKSRYSQVNWGMIWYNNIWFRSQDFSRNLQATQQMSGGKVHWTARDWRYTPENWHGNHHFQAPC